MATKISWYSSLTIQSNANERAQVFLSARILEQQLGLRGYNILIGSDRRSEIQTGRSRAAW